MMYQISFYANFLLSFLAKRNEIDPFRKRIVTGDEKWVAYDNIVRKRSWSNRSEAAQTARKILPCIWWDWKGIVYHELLLYDQILNDEAHFWLNGYVNKQNCRIWSEANPQVYVETPLHPEKLTVWCALWAGGIIGPYFFKNDEGHNVTVNGAVVPTRRRNMSHTARATIDLLKDTFGDRLISRFGPVNWPPRSCDLTPLDYFLWGYVKSLVYAYKPQTLDHLEDNIRRVIADIRPQMLEKVIENWTSRLDYIRASRGSPMPEIIFKM
ncbi:DDE_3 domain-containing protein [Trichonephila clavipes]|nr:DDE_3 domain-containing protein [Trichonephila clavipes]